MSHNLSETTDISVKMSRNISSSSVEMSRNISSTPVEIARNISSSQVGMTKTEKYSIYPFYYFFPAISLLLVLILVVSFLEFKKNSDRKNTLVERLILLLFCILTTAGFAVTFYNEHFNKVYSHFLEKGEVDLIFPIWNTGLVYSLLIFLLVSLIEYKSSFDLEILTEEIDFIEGSHCKSCEDEVSTVKPLMRDDLAINGVRVYVDEIIVVGSNNDTQPQSDNIKSDNIKSDDSNKQSKLENSSIKGKKEKSNFCSLFSAILSVILFLSSFIFISIATSSSRSIMGMDKANDFCKHFYMILSSIYTVMSLSSLISHLHCRKQKKLNI